MTISPMAGRRAWLKAATLAGAVALFVALHADQALATHVRCGDTITQDTKLDSDLIDCRDIGLIIGAENITLDLNGHMIDGGPGIDRGILNAEPYGAPGFSGVTIEDGTVREFTVPIHLTRARHNRIRRTSLFSESANGIVLDGTRETRVEDNLTRGISLVPFSSGRDLVAESNDNVIEGNSIVDGRVYVQGSSNRVAKNTVSGNYFAGIDLIGERNSVYRNDVAVSGELWGISLLNASNTRLVGNSVSNAQGDGILLSRAADNLIAKNSVFGNGQDGIVLEEDSSRNDVVRNTASNNGAVGIAVEARFGYFAGSDNSIRENSTKQNGTDGISVEALSSGTLLEANVAERNLDDGIDVDASATTLRTNRANFNGDLGIEAVPGTRDGGGNKAKGNGNPVQCINVACK